MPSDVWQPPIINVSGTVEMVEPTAVQNIVEGISFENDGTNTITGATVTDNGRKGIRALISGSITGSTITGNTDQGIDLDWDGADPVDGVTLSDTDTSDNGHGGGESGARLRNVNGPVVVTNCFFDNNGSDGFSPEESVIGDLEIFGGRANGNQDEGYDLRVTGNATVIGARAINNVDAGFAAEMPGTIFFQNCVANGNQTGDGFNLQWQEPDPIDGISVINSTANNNGLLDGGEGINIRHVEGPVTVAGCSASGNAYSGVRVREAGGPVLIRAVTATTNLEEGIEIDVDGPVTIVDNVANGNVSDGLNVDSNDFDVSSISIKRNTFVDNGGTGVVLLGLGGSGPFKAKCNDVAGNSFGMSLDDPVTVDARHVWWGHSSGPSSEGPGTGDGVVAGSGGNILFDPWLADSFTAPVSGCPIFESDFESGLAEEWDVVVSLGRTPDGEG